MAGTKKKVSMQKIADQLGVSKYAVSLALNGKPGVSETLRESVTRTAQELNYQRLKKNPAGKSRNILVLIPSRIRNDMAFYNAVYWAIENEGSRLGYSALLTSVSDEMEEKRCLPGVYANAGCAGIITVGVFAESYVGKLASLSVPLVSVDQQYDTFQVNAVVAANAGGACQAVQHLIGLGHRDIGFIGPITMASSIFERWCGYRRAMMMGGLPVPEAHCITEASPLNVMLADPDLLEDRVKKMKDLPTAWFCSRDMIAISLIGALRKLGLGVPDDISVASFDDIETASLIVPKLTTYNAPRTMMGRAAVRLLLQKPEDVSCTRKITLYGKLAVRDSAAKPKPEKRIL